MEAQNKSGIGGGNAEPGRTEMESGPVKMEESLNPGTRLVSDQKLQEESAVLDSWNSPQEIETLVNTRMKGMLAIIVNYPPTELERFMKNCLSSTTLTLEEVSTMLNNDEILYDLGSYRRKTPLDLWTTEELFCAVAQIDHEIKTMAGRQVAGAVELISRYVRCVDETPNHQGIMYLAVAKLRESIDTRHLLERAMKIMAPGTYVSYFMENIWHLIVNGNSSNYFHMITNHVKRNELTDEWEPVDESTEPPPDICLCTTDPERTLALAKSLARNYKSIGELKLETLAVAASIEKLELTYDDYESVLDQIRESCNGCQAILSVMTARVYSEFDVPDRSVEWNDQNSCRETKHGKYCLVRSTNDYRILQSNRNKPAGFIRNCLKFISAAKVNLVLMTQESARNRKLSLLKVKSAPYVVMLTESPDEQIMEFEMNPGFFEDLYFVRSKIGLNGDYGYKKKLGGFESQTGDGIFDWIKSFVPSSENDVMKFVKKTISTVVDRILGAFGLITTALKTILKWMIDLVEKWIINHVVSKFFSNDGLTKEVRDCLAGTVVLIIVLMSTIAGLIGTGVGLMTVRCLARMQAPKTEFEPQGDVDAIATVVAVMVGIFGLTQTTKEGLRKRCLELTAVFAGGTVCAKGIHLIWCLVPEALRYSMTAKFATQTYKDKMEVEEWSTMATAIITAARTQLVLGSKIFYERVQDVMRKGTDMISRIKEVGLRSIFIRVYSQLLNLSTILNQKKYSQGSRKLPFAVHVSGDPGIGKTLIVPRLVDTVTGAGPDETYYRNISDEYWNAFMGERIIIMDEFMIGDVTRKTELAAEYLTLVSTARFMPPMASLENASVGIKGTVALPDLVVTINNSLYDRPPMINVSAFQRRRKCVIECIKSENFKTRDGINVDMSAYTKEEQRNFAWMNFRIRPGMWTADNVDTSPLMTFDTLAEIMKGMYDDHNVIANNLADALGGDMRESKTPEMIMDEIIRDSFGIPKKPLSIKDALVNIFMGEQAEDEFIEHSHTCCKLSAVHRKRSSDFVCRMCKTTQTCASQMMAVRMTTKNPDLSRDVDETPDHRNTNGHLHSHACGMPSCDRRVPCLKVEADTVVCADHKAMKVELELFANGDVAHDTEQYRKMIEEMLMKQTHFQWCLFYPGRDEPKDGLASQVTRSLLFSFGIAVLIGLKRLFQRQGKISEVEDYKITFGPQSDPRSKQSKQQRRTRHTFGKGFQAQAAGVVMMARLEIVGVREINVICLREKWILTFFHGFYREGQRLPEGTQMRLKFREEEHTFNFASDNLISCGTRDIALLQIPTLKNVFKSCLPHFPNRNELETTPLTTVVLDTDHGSKYSTAKLVHNQFYAGQGQMVELDDAWRYKMLTIGGDCGFPLIATAGKLIGKVLGIHVAGTNNTLDVPEGMATVVLREEIEDALSLKEPEFIEDAQFVEQGSDVKLGPNCVKYEIATRQEMIHCPSKTKIKPSLIHGLVGHDTKKNLPILSKNDPRSKGRDPIIESINDTLSTKHPPLDRYEVAACFEPIYYNYKARLEWVEPKRHLTFEEACMGLAGKLSSLRTETSPGYPLLHFSKKKGKKDYIWFDGNGDFHYDPDFKTLVEEKVTEMEYYKRDMMRDGTVNMDHMFIGYLKDELLSDAKIDECRVRMIYANDLVCLVAFRIYYGTLLTAINNSNVNLPSAIGLNQYSYDMSEIYRYLKEAGNHFVAGDYKSFDKRQHPQFRDEAYGVLERLAEGLHRGASFKFMVDHETNTPAQIEQHRFWTVSNHMSGCFWTTILNNLINEAYMRWCFSKINPNHLFDDHCRLKVLGDDHILCVSDSVNMLPVEIGKVMKEIGQEYTSAEKGKELENHYVAFDEITFLGAQPRRLNGQWTGAMKKDTLFETVQWTRDNNMSLQPTCVQMIEAASQWDEKFFNHYQDCLCNALMEYDLILERKSWKELSRVVARRDRLSGYTFTGFRAQGPPIISTQPSVAAAAPGQVRQAETLLTNIEGSVQGLTTIKTSAPGYTVLTDHSKLSMLADKSLNEKALDMDYGLESNMFRTRFEWQTDQNRGENIFTVAIPFGLLALGNLNNIQNMAFQRFIYTVFDVEIVIQVNGVPTMQGCLLAYFYPLSDDRPNITNATMCDGVAFISPNQNTSTSVKIPFRYIRSAMNTYAGGLGEETLGNFYIDVLSPLVNLTDDAQCTISIYSAFHAKMTIPRPVPDGTRDMISTKTQYRIGYEVAHGDLSLRRVPARFVAQGASYSTITTNNSVTAGDIVGGVPIQGPQIGVEQTTEGSLSLPLPMDNPPATSGGIPTYPQFSGMSKSNGLEPTVGMQLHPQQMHREHSAHFDPNETKVETIMNRRGLLNAFTLTTSDADGMVILTVPLTSILFDFAPSAPQIVIPCHIAVLNQFLFWRADLVFDFMAVRTTYHSARLIATVAYGAPGITNGEQNVFYNHVLEFSGENSWASITVPYNAATEFLRTYDGPGATHQVQNYSLGSLAITVQNRLRTTTQIVSDEVEVLMFVSFKNVRVYEARNHPTAVISRGTRLFGNYEVNLLTTVAEEVEETSGPVSTARYIPRTTRFVAQAGDDLGGLVVVDPVPQDSVAPESTPMTNSETVLQTAPVCKLDIGRKFEYCITDIHELMRRHSGFWHGKTGGLKDFTLDVYPRSPFAGLYAGWAGHLKYRIFTRGTSGMQKWIYVPTYGPNPMSGYLTEIGSKTTYQNTSVPPVSYTINTLPNLSFHGPLEMMYTYGTAVRTDGTDTGNLDMIDLSIPFNSIYNFHPTLDDTVHLISRRTGVIQSRALGSENDVAVNFEFYEAVGDDFKLGIWRPPTLSTFEPIFTTPASYPSGPFPLGGFIPS